MNSEDRCPRCGEAKLLSWRELDGDQRAVVPRLPGAVNHTQQEREVLLRWCPRCWFEATVGDATC